MLGLTASCQQEHTRQSVPPQPPNIIYILADDLGYGDISALNGESAIQTPHMDRLISEGIHFTDAHSASAVCTPTRYGILTGRNAWRSTLKSGVLWGYSAPLIEPLLPTIASFLKERGYHTAVVGKWHLGLGWQPLDTGFPIEQYDWVNLFNREKGSNVDFSKSVSGGPSQLGFDYSFIFPASLDMTPYVYLENDHVVQKPDDYTEGRSEAKHGRGVFWRAGEISPGLKIEEVLQYLAQKAIDYIDNREEKDHPFFLYFPLTAPHAPWVPSEDVRGSSQAGRYGDFVTLVDQTIGEVLKALDQRDLSRNTLVLLTSDNGAHWTKQDKQHYAHRSNFIFKGQKADIYEGGHRIPYVVRWPGKIPAGSSSSQLISTTDFYATMAGIIGEEVPAGSVEDSYDMSEAYLQTVSDPIRTTMIQHSLNGSFAIREGRWKYTPQLGSGGFTEPVDQMPQPGEPVGTLYDLETDPTEERNLIAQHPERAQKMHRMLQSMTGQQF